MSKLAFIFPGQGAQKAGMGKDFYENSEAARSFFDQAQKNLDFDLKEMCFGEHEELNLTEYTQPCMVSVCLAIVRELKKRGINPDITAGLSLGEYAAVAAAGGMNELDAIKLVRRRGILMQSTVPAGEGAMAAVLGLDAKKIEEILESFENVWIANYNCPGQIVITGLTNEVQQASLALKEAGAKRVVELKVSGPFHSLLLKPAGEALLKEMESMSFSTLQVPYVANATAEIVTDSKKISTFFAKGIYSSVRWQQSIETMLENGVDTFVEIGPGKTLAGFMRKIAPKATVYNVSSFEDAIALEKCLSKA
jgi:[acyl-carrier-protein] S-malonyltransferase